MKAARFFGTTRAQRDDAAQNIRACREKLRESLKEEEREFWKKGLRHFVARAGLLSRETMLPGTNKPGHESGR
jgi:hypothetical protein